MPRVRRLIFACSTLLLPVVALSCGGDEDSGGGNESEARAAAAALEAVPTNMTLTSMVFGDGGDIPGAHTCYVLDRSPPLAWSGVPEGAASLVLIVRGANAEGVNDGVHWVVYDLPADVDQLPGSVSITQETVSGGTQGRNSEKRRGWVGPCPEKGGDHAGTYVFNLYALDASLGLTVEGGASRSDVLAAMAGRVIGRGEITGTYCHTDAPWSPTGSRGSCPPVDHRLGAESL